MLPIVVGTVKNTVKLAVLDNKWQQKKKSGGKAFEKSQDPMARQIQQYKEDLEKMRESNKMASIQAKLKSGQGLTPDEIEYLQKNAPEAYREYVEIQSEKEAYERQLRNCKTKEDVDRLKVSKINGYLTEAKSVSNNPNIPDGQKLGLIEKILKKVMGIQKVHMKFVESGRYKDLPTEEELAEEAKEKVEQMTNTEDTESAEMSDTEDEQESIENPEVPDAENQPENTEAPDGKEESEGAGEASAKRKPVLEEPNPTDSKDKPADIFHAAKRELTKYLRNSGSSGRGLEYLIDEPEHKKKIKG